jgi:hypothetical protein
LLRRVYKPSLFLRGLQYIYVKGIQVVFVVLTKFQVKYQIRVDRESTFERALAHNLLPDEGGGRPTIGDVPSRAQLIIPLKNGAKVLFGPNKVQVYWSNDYDDINEIEEFLNGLVAFRADEIKRFDRSTRVSVPTLRIYEKEIAEVKADLEHQKWKLEVADMLKHAAWIRNGQVSDFMRVNRIYYLSSAKTAYERLKRLLDEGVRNGWVCDDSIRTEIARLGKIVDSGGRH